MLFITSYFEESRDALDKASRKLIFPAIQLLENNPKADSLKLHRVNKVKCDPNFWSARVNDNIRIIFVQIGEDKKLLYVDRHDDAYDWCEGKYYDKTKFGAEVIVDSKLEMQKAESFVPDEEAVEYGETPLLVKNNIREKDLDKLGISEIHAKNLLTICDDDKFLEYIDIFPAEIQEALCDLITGKPFDQVLNSLIDESFDNGETKEQKDTQRRFHMLQSLDELEALLNSDDFEAWTLFLHPEQDKLVRMNFNGPALIEGGPGTGKTVVGIHRAAYLAQNVFKPEDGKKILFCTYSAKLAKSISEKLDLLLFQRGLENKNITVQSVDSYILSLCKTVCPDFGKIAMAQDMNQLIREKHNEISPEGSYDFYRYEYDEVIEKNNIKTLEEYLDVERTGTGLGLNKAQREKAWKFIKEILAEKENRGWITYADAAHIVKKALDAGQITKRFDSIIIDEAQDLEPIKLQVLAESVISDKNNVYILSDVNQRIYKLSSWKKESGINIVGRTRYLFINYRTTKQINDYARYQFIQSEIVREHIVEYKSIFSGDPPVVEEFRSEADQKRYVVKTVRILSDVYPQEQICVICPTNEDCNTIMQILDYEGIPSTILEGDKLPKPGNGISICPVQGVKGLEFRAVVIYNYLKIGSFVNRYSMHSKLWDNYIKQAECQKYVATTRARDELYVTYVEEDN